MNMVRYIQFLKAQSGSITTAVCFQDLATKVSTPACVFQREAMTHKCCAITVAKTIIACAPF